MKIYYRTETIEYTPQAGQTLLEVFQELQLSGPESPCGGKGTCRKCLVDICRSKGAARESVLSCQTKAETDMEVWIAAGGDVVIAEAGTCHLYPTDGGENYALACDIGTTTVVCHLLRRSTGERLATVSATNAQKAFGGDVIARISACIAGKRQQLQDAITGQIDGMIGDLCGKAGIRREEITAMAVAGNTTMEHIFAGLKPDGIGVAPFTPESLFGTLHRAADLGLHFGPEGKGEVYMIPAIAGYVGGDITADMISVQMQKAEGQTLLLDIGTNGEMTLGNRDRIISCATAAGPAFEGAEISMGMPAQEGAISKVWVEEDAAGLQQIRSSTIGNQPAVGICGSGLIDALACMIELEIIDETGAFADPDDLPEHLADCMDEDDDGDIFLLTDSVKITQGDVRKLQLAKAAIAAGVQVMLEEAGLSEDDITRLVLAGGFGSFLQPESAAKIGLIPEKLLPVTEAVGNAAGEGAVSAVLSEQAREDLEALQEKVEYVELSTHKAFTGYYMDAMYFYDIGD